MKKTISESQVSTLINLIRQVFPDVGAFLADKPFDHLREMPESEFEAAEADLWVRLQRSLGG